MFAGGSRARQQAAILKRGLMVMVASAVVGSMIVTAANGQTPANPSPRNHPGDWVTDGDYPDTMLRQHVQGDVDFRLTVGADGLPKTCDVTQSSGAPELDTSTCSLLLARAQFHPARDPHGKAVEGNYANRIRWVLPQSDVLEAPTPYSYDLTFVLGTDGKVSDCAFSNVLGIPDEGTTYMLEQCRQQVFEPYRDEKGSPVARQVTRHFKVKVEPVK